MLKKILLITVIIPLFILAGCATTSGSTASTAAAPAPAAANNADLPDFFLMPPSAEDAYYGVGSAKMSSLNTSKTMAISRARDDISRQVNLNVKNAITDYASEAGIDNSQSLKYVETVSRQISETSLQGSKPKEMYLAKDGTIYALVEYRTAVYIEEVSEIMKKIQDTSPIAIKAEKALEKMKEDLAANPPKSDPVTK